MFKLYVNRFYYFIGKKRWKGLTFTFVQSGINAAII